MKRLIAAGLLSVSPTIAIAVPSVTSQTPAINILTALEADNIVVNFNENIKAASVTNSSFIVTGSLSGPHTGTFAVSGSQITLNPTEDFKVGETVTVTLTTGIQNDASSAPMAIPQTWQFKIITLGIGKGNFSSHPTTPTFGSTGEDGYDIVLGDLDGDGDLDAFIVTYDLELIFLNDGTGNFTAHPVTPSIDGGDDSKEAVLGDIDGDGDLDVIVSTYNDVGEKVWINDGIGNFSAHPTTPTFGSSIGKYSAISMGDLDGDGDLDVVAAKYGGDSL
ncbi:MAG: Ig-like domain-containing protein, partial [Candidatus Marithrix sp.]|nr:Ig-like domain-containing protein [Candidatus Marithrix sp.]